jgi:LCP family protein required for cell wall assembly
VAAARRFRFQSPAELAAGAGYNNSVPHGFRVWHAGPGYGLPGVSAISLVEATELNGVPFVPAVPTAGPVASVRRALRVVSALVAIAVILSTGLAWGKFRSFEDGILHITSPLLGAGGDDGAIDILMVGLDSRTDAHGNPLSDDELAKLHAGDDDGTTNTDTIILVRIPNNGKSATAISIPRDSYVQAPGLGKTKINGVYGQTKEQKRTQLVESGVSNAEASAQATQAGREALIKTVADLTGVTVDHYAEIGLLGFALITDAIGGVNVCLKDAVYEPLSGADFPAGWQRLDGPQALSFVRQRHDLPRGDLDRVVRQQVVMASLAHEVISGKTLSSPARLDALQDAIQRSMVISDGWDIMDYIKALENLAAGNVAFATIPVLDEAGWSDDGTQSVVRVDPAKVQQWVKGLLNDQQQGKTEQLAYTPAKTTVEVANDSNIGGLAAAVSQVLANSGFTPGPIGNHEGGHVADSQVQATKINDLGAQAVAKQLGGLPIVVNASVKPDTVRVVLAADYTGPGSGLDGSDPTALTVDPAAATPTNSSAPPRSPIITAGSNDPRCVD